MKRHLKCPAIINSFFKDNFGSVILFSFFYNQIQEKYGDQAIQLFNYFEFHTISNI